MHIDEPTGMAEHLYLYGLCDACVSGFRAYLEDRFEPDYLLDHFGIEDIVSFDYRVLCFCGLEIQRHRRRA